jgi:hypothetical protein
MALEPGKRVGDRDPDLVSLNSWQQRTENDFFQRLTRAGMLEAIRRHKAGIVALLTALEGDWTAEDWRVSFNERAGIAEFDSRWIRTYAEAFAFECCIVEWLNRLPQHPDPGRCPWCEKPDQDGHAVVLFGTESDGHACLHTECWDAWYGAR